MSNVTGFTLRKSAFDLLNRNNSKKSKIEGCKAVKRPRYLEAGFTH
jgi:hypothetical protein